MDKAEKSTIDFMLEMTYRPIVMKTVATFIAKKQIEEEQRLANRNFSKSEIGNILRSNDFKREMQKRLMVLSAMAPYGARDVIKEMGLEKDSQYNYLHDKIQIMFIESIKSAEDLLMKNQVAQIYSYIT